ncbi:MAG: hypothetical protein M1333_01285 [Patescibacteria group bacterium]|nr:hypothetical protein [Patescibacteria group bacterium]
MFRLKLNSESHPEQRRALYLVAWKCGYKKLKKRVGWEVELVPRNGVSRHLDQALSAFFRKSPAVGSWEQA